jgi:hypothetical protein
MHTLFGLSVRSDVPLLFSDLPEIDPVDVVIQRAPKDVFTSPEPHIKNLKLDILEVAEFQIQAGRQIEYIPCAGVTDDMLRVCLLGWCMGAVLQQRGLIVLHGNAVSFDNQTADIYVGDKGAGKSTMAAWCYQQGASIISDDVCAIYFNAAGLPVVLPSYPQFRLWQNSLDLLGMSHQNLRRVRAGLDKFIVPVETSRFMSHACVIKKISLIDSQIKSQVPLLGSEKLLMLQAQTYRYYFLPRMQMEHAYIKQLMCLSSKLACIKMPRINCKEACFEQ